MIFLNLSLQIILMCKTKMGSIPKIFNNNFSSVDHAYPIHFSLNSFQLPRSLQTSKFSIILRGPKLWNDFLTNAEKNNSSLFSFKRAIK